MTDGVSRAVSPVTVVVAVTLALALATAAVLVVALDGDDEAVPTTTLPAPSSTTTAAVERQVSLVSDGERGTFFDVAGVAVSARDLSSLTADNPVPADYPAVIDPAFVAAQEDADLSLERLRNQVQYLANRLGPAVADAGLEPALVVVARPRLDEGTLDAAVLVVNTAPIARRLEFFDLRIFGAGSAPATDRIRFLSETGGVEIAAGTAYFNLVVFSSDQVVDPDVDLSEYSWDADVLWSDAGPPEGGDPDS